MPHLARIKVRRDAICKRTRFRLRDIDIRTTKIDRWIKTQKKNLGDDGFMSLIQTESKGVLYCLYWYDCEEMLTYSSQFRPLPRSFTTQKMTATQVLIRKHWMRAVRMNPPLWLVLLQHKIFVHIKYQKPFTSRKLTDSLSLTQTRFKKTAR